MRSFAVILEYLCNVLDNANDNLNFNNNANEYS